MMAAAPLDAPRPLPAAATADLPAVDISALLRPSSAASRGAAAAAIAAACASHGAFYAVNTGISGAQRQSVFDAGTAFFAQPPAAKQAIAADPVAASRGFARGFIGIGGESGSAELREVKEGYSYGFDWPATKPPENPLQGPNAWPADGALGGFDSMGFRACMNGVYSACYQVSQAIAGGLAEALEQPALLDACKGSGGETISLMRMFRYLPYGADPALGLQQQAEEGDASTAADAVPRIGSSPHTDWGFLTLVLQQDLSTGGSDDGGLEIWDHTPADRGWLRVPPVEGSLVVNVGDYLSLLSGGRFISPLHRVTMPETAAAAAASEAGSSSGSDGSRTSLVFFAYPEYAARLSLTRPEDAMRTSLLQQQQEEEEAGGAREQGRARTAEEAAAALAEVPFGEYILNKWGQVSRL
jgi:isopenicillin N synthase-like dioxygenase